MSKQLLFILRQNRGTKAIKGTLKLIDRKQTINAIAKKKPTNNSTQDTTQKSKD